MESNYFSDKNASVFFFIIEYLLYKSGIIANEEYFGKDCIIDEQIKYEWARIPHFYTPFYVYKYATGISAAIIIATNILAGKEGYVEKYINMLKQGCTKKAVELLKMVDVDLEDINTYKGAINFYRELTKELKKLI